MGKALKVLLRVLIVCLLLLAGLWLLLMVDSASAQNVTAPEIKAEKLEMLQEAAISLDQPKSRASKRKKAKSVNTPSKWTPRMERIARDTEAKYNLPHGVCRAFALQESNYDSLASRVETGYFNLGSTYYNGISNDSRAFLMLNPNVHIPLWMERAQRSISHGMYQVMGQNYRAMGYSKEFIDPTLEEQFEYFGKFVSNLFKRYKTLPRVASAYNTGSPDKTYRQYVKNILNYQRKFSY